MAWLDTARMEQRILDEIWSGYYGTLTSLAAKNRVTLTTESLQNLAECLYESYGKVQLWALGQYESLSTMGSMGLYMDGDTANSDYDIISDIEKINHLIFTENIPYDGKANSSKRNLSNLISGKPITPLFSTGILTELNTILGVTENIDPRDTLPGTQNTNVDSLSTLWIWQTCSIPGGSSTVADIATDAFLEELWNTLAWGWLVVDGGWSYGESGVPPSWTGGTWATANQLATSKSDFFHTARCESVFCIKVKMVSGTSPLFVGSQNVSIESILDKHINELEPISWTELGLQKMTNNMLQVPYTGLSLKLKMKVKWWGVYMGEKPTPKDRYKKEDTKEARDLKFEQARRCGLYDAGFESANPNIVNSIMGAGFVTRMGENTENKGNTATRIAATSPEDVIWLANCMRIAIEDGRSTYYESFSDDLSEIETFTRSMIREINEILNIGEKIDTLKVL
jgi:hypothetical protein